MQTGDLIQVVERSHFWLVNALAVRPDGQILACCTREGQLQVWDLLADRLFYLSSECSPSAMSPDGRVLVCCTKNREIYFWDLESNKQLCLLSGHAAPIQAIALSGDREFISSYSADGQVLIWGAL